jgi:glycosyltransferase involved in cell wall biosynthesis
MEGLNILSIGGLVPWHPEAGGGQIIAYKTSKALALAGHDVHHLAIAPEKYQRQVNWGTFAYAREAPGFVASVAQALRPPRSDLSDDHDIVHVHLGNETVTYCLAYALTRRIRPKPRLVLSTYAPKAYALPRSIGEVITALSCHSADLVLALSEFSKRDIARAYRIPSSKIAVTSAGVDPTFASQISRRDRGGDGPFLLLFCGRLNGPHEQKGIDVLLKSLAMVLRQHEVVLHMVGTGPRLDQYRVLARDLGVEQSVIFEGFVEHDQMPAHYARADLFVLPSRRESFGLVLAEAMACGLPVVATTAGAIPEVVVDGVTGLLVQPDSPEALASAVVSLLNDPQRMKTMGAAGSERVRELFTWDRVAERVADGYDRAL